MGVATCPIDLLHCTIYYKNTERAEVQVPRPLVGKLRSCLYSTAGDDLVSRASPLQEEGGSGQVVL